MSVFACQALGYTVGTKPILTDISFTVAAGEYVTISGPSGSGKSTLLRLLATLLSPTSGTITYNDKPQANYDKIVYRREVSYCFQQPSLFGTTVLDNFTFPYAIRQQSPNMAAIDQALTAMQLPTSILHQPLTALSGGEKQRVALIRNVLCDPQVLLLDEVTTGLDHDTKTQVHQFIEGLNKQGTTVLAVTHDESEIAVAHRLLTIDQGRLAVVA